MPSYPGPLDGRGVAAKQRHRLALLVDDLHVVDPAPAAAFDLHGLGAEMVVDEGRREVVDRAARAHRALVVRIAGETEGRVREREDEAAVADLLAVGHVL